MSNNQKLTIPEVSVIITAANESKTISKALECILDQNYSGLPDFSELITVIPDKSTLIEAEKTIRKFNYKNWINIQDPNKGKPHALNLGLKMAQGKILILTDGDVFFGSKVMELLLDKFKNSRIGGVTGRPRAVEDKKNFWGYTANLLADGAHQKRLKSMANGTENSPQITTNKKPFYILSGYIAAIRNLKPELQLPEDCLVDDAFISYVLFNQGYELIYEPRAEVYVKYPNNLKDWFDQKARSVGGYMQLWKYKVVNKDTKVRNIWKELEFLWFPIKYAQNLRELFWSKLLYPIRLYLWLRIFWEQKILKKEFYKTWVRIESTK